MHLQSKISQCKSPVKRVTLQTEIQIFSWSASMYDRYNVTINNKVYKQWNNHRIYDKIKKRTWLKIGLNLLESVKYYHFLSSLKLFIVQWHVRSTCSQTSKRSSASYRKNIQKRSKGILLTDNRSRTVLCTM